MLFSLKPGFYLTLIPVTAREPGWQETKDECETAHISATLVTVTSTAFLLTAAAILKNVQVLRGSPSKH